MMTESHILFLDLDDFPKISFPIHETNESFADSIEILFPNHSFDSQSFHFAFLADPPSLSRNFH